MSFYNQPCFAGISQLLQGANGCWVLPQGLKSQRICHLWKSHQLKYSAYLTTLKPLSGVQVEGSSKFNAIGVEFQQNIEFSYIHLEEQMPDS